MSNISTVYDAIITKMASLFPSKSRFPNAYSETDNPEHLLRDAYGIRYDGENLIPGQFNTIANQHEFTIIFTRELIRLDADVAEFDVIAKGLLEDASTVRKNFYDVIGIGTTAVELIEPTSTSAITQVYGGKNNFFKIETGFTMNIKEEYPC